MIGWMGPVGLVIPYFLIKQQYENDFCWMDYGYSQYILSIPTAIILITNSFIACWVILTIRNQQSIIVEMTNSIRRIEENKLKFARIVLMLTPIFGLQFIFIPIRDTSKTNEYYVQKINKLAKYKGPP